MLFVALLKTRAGTMAERVGRRAQWQYPSGVKLIGEYWLHTADPRIVSVLAACRP